jgi:hypothetical protein
MSFWNKVGDILELLGQRLQTPEYIMCCGGEWEDELDRNRPAADPPPPLTIAPSENAAAKLSSRRPLGNS